MRSLEHEKTKKKETPQISNGGNLNLNSFCFVGTRCHWVEPVVRCLDARDRRHLNWSWQWNMTNFSKEWIPTKLEDGNGNTHRILTYWKWICGKYSRKRKYTVIWIKKLFSIHTRPVIPLKYSWIKCIKNRRLRSDQIG